MARLRWWWWRGSAEGCRNNLEPAELLAQALALLCLLGVSKSLGKDQTAITRRKKKSLTHLSKGGKKK